MHAYQLLAHGNPGRSEYRSVPDPAPGAGQAVVRVRACGLNHLDLWAEQGALPVALSLPLTQGCEAAGTVTALGAGVAGWRLGDRVAVQSNLYCGECESCRAGEESMCLNNVMLGVQCDGGFAEQVAVPERALVKLPETVSFETSAALSLAASTAMHMIHHRVQVRAGDWVLVMAGASGVGSAAIQIARALGARVISTGSTEAKRQLARRLGAEHALDPAGERWPAEVRALTGKRGVDVAVDHVGGAVLPNVFQCLARGGAVVTCGATAGKDVVLDLWPLFVKQYRLIGSYGRNRSDLIRTLEWAADGKLQAVIDATYDLAATGSAFERLRSRSVLGKVLVIPVANRRD